MFLKIYIYKTEWLCYIIPRLCKIYKAKFRMDMDIDWMINQAESDIANISCTNDLKGFKSVNTLCACYENTIFETFCLKDLIIILMTSASISYIHYCFSYI